MMIDTHIHLIPNVDDGAKDLEMSINMAKRAVNDGTSIIIATPHYSFPEFINDIVIQEYQRLIDKITEEKLDLKVYLGNEVHLNDEGVLAILNQDAYSLAGSDYYLVELPFYQYYPVHDELIFRLIASGKRLILAHVERYVYFQKETNKLKELIDKGCYGQVTSSYITNKKTMKKAIKLIEMGLIHIVASDGHNLNRRSPDLFAGYQQISKRFGEAVAEELFLNNPNRIINNEAIQDLFFQGQYKKNKWFHF